MKLIFLILFSVTLNAFSQTALSINDQLQLKYSDKVLEYLQENDPNLYQGYIAELESSFEFIDIDNNLSYPELLAYDFINMQEKEAPIFSESSFSLYNYKFDRNPEKDIIYKIPGTVKGILIYSKSRFLKSL